MWQIVFESSFIFFQNIIQIYCCAISESLTIWIYITIIVFPLFIVKLNNFIFILLFCFIFPKELFGLELFYLRQKPAMDMY